MVLDYSRWDNIDTSGSEDETVPLEDSRALAAAAGFRLIEIEGGSHGLGSVAADGSLCEYVRQAAATRAAG